MNNKNCICVFGEVLFDHFPTGDRVLGGALFNVAWHLQAFSQAPVFISRVGDDAEGREIREAMQHWGMCMEGVQQDSERATGRVDISIVNNEPSFDIVEHCAYDAIEPVYECSKDCRLLYHGSLALREAQSREALDALKTRRPPIVFVDINLRPPWWQLEHVQQIMNDADWVKLNTDELASIYPAYKTGDKVSPEVLSEYELKGMIVTHGADGAEVFVDGSHRYFIQPESDIDIVDTVGAGDAFTAITIMGLVNNWEINTTLQRAQEFASAIVGRRGATVSEPAFYATFTDQWELTSI